MRLTRREFVVGAAALPWAVRAVALEPAPRFVLLGSDKGKGIYRASWDATTGTMGIPELAIATDRPTYLARHPRLPVLYAANEAAVGDGSVSAFRMGRDGALTAMGSVDAQGGGTCYVSVDQTGRSMFAANYGGGTVARIAVGADGRLGEVAGVFDCKGNAACGVLGPNASRQEAAHMHCATVTPDNRQVLACNLGEDAIEVFSIAMHGVDKPVRVAARAGSGPRHVACHPNGRWVYCIHELDCTVDLYEWRGSELRLRPESVVTTLAKGAVAGGSTGCEVVVSDDGRFLYANTRGAETLTVYAIGPTGLLTEQQRVASGGTVTRLIALDPSRRWMLGMHQGSGGVTVMAHDARTGRLGEARGFAAETPMCVIWC